MKTLIFIFFATTIIPGFAQSAVTGSQCQSHLAQVTDLLKRENLDSYWKANDEIPNVLGTSLGQIASVSSQEPVVNDFVNSVNTAILECQTHCGGVPKRNGQKISCKELRNKTVWDINNLIKNIDGDFISNEEEYPVNPVHTPEITPVASQDSTSQPSPCANGWETDSCQVFLDSLTEEERITARATFASSLPECANGRRETDSCQVTLDQIFNLSESPKILAEDSEKVDSLL